MERAKGEQCSNCEKKSFKSKKKSVNAMRITFSIRHPVVALVVRHCNLVRNDFLVEDDNRVIKTSRL